MFRNFLLITFIVGSVNCYTFVVKDAKSSDHEGYCFYDNVLVKVNESELTPNCERITCNSDYSISGAGCGVYHVDIPNCEIVKDPSKLYPECCGDLICH